MKPMVLALGALLALPASAQVFKCAVNGSTVYQARPCGATGGTGQEVKLYVSPGAAPVAPASTPPAEKPAPARPAPEPVPMPPPPPQKSGLELEADACLEWYRPMLRDPRSAYYRNPTREANVVTVTIYATNGFGGYVTKLAACEIKSGQIDEGWTKMHAERLKWGGP